MFCGNCGKEIIGNTKFCQFCGAEQNAVVIPGASIPAPTSEPDDMTSTPISSTPISSTPISDTSISNTSISSTPLEPNVTSMGVPSDESVPAASAAAMSEPTGITSLPTPNSIPTNNIGITETSVRTIPAQPAAPTKMPASAVPQTEITIKDEEKRPPERKYSLRHIVMCLAAAAVMAVAAGVFAGLYFSVIMA